MVKLFSMSQKNAALKEDVVAEVENPVIENDNLIK